MFDFAFSEIALVGVVALLVIGPKDMPVAVKAIAGALKKARRMAGEFQGHVDEMMREADLHEVRDTINDLRSMNIKGKILNAVDGDGGLRRTLSENPMHPTPPTAAAPSSAEPAAVEEPVAPAWQGSGASMGLSRGAGLVSSFPSGPAPSFVPPAEAEPVAPPAPSPAPAPPAFIPPDAAAPHP